MSVTDREDDPPSRFVESVSHKSILIERSGRLSWCVTGFLRKVPFVFSI